MTTTQPTPSAFLTRLCRCGALAALVVGLAAACLGCASGGGYALDDRPRNPNPFGPIEHAIEADLLAPPPSATTDQLP